jgi:anti-sigma factor RsiW
MSAETDISDVELHAFIDGELDAGRLQEIEAGIAANPVLAERIAAFRSDKDLLKRVYAPLIDGPIPKEWLALAHGSAAPAQPAISWRLIGSVAAAIALVVIGGLGYWELQPPAANEVVQAALDARGSSAGEIIAIQAGTDARQYDAVLSSAVALKVKVPDLKRLGYEPTGIRLYPHSASGSAAELLYRDGNDRVFTLYLRRSDGTARFDQFERDGLRVCVWQDEELSTVMAGNVSTAAMQRLASLAYTGLTL